MRTFLLLLASLAVLTTPSSADSSQMVAYADDVRAEQVIVQDCESNLIAPDDADWMRPAEDLMMMDADCQEVILR